MISDDRNLILAALFEGPGDIQVDDDVVDHLSLSRIYLLYVNFPRLSNFL